MIGNGLTKAMILAAGFGSRLKPLTDKIPKALVEFNGKPMVANVITKLKKIGIEEIIINIHHFHQQIEEYFTKNDFGVKISLIYEKEILGTGGAIKNAASFLDHSGDFLVYNVDVNSDMSISEMYNFHIFNNSFVTLAVKKRRTGRPLIVDSYNKLLGRYINSEKKLYRPYSGEHLETAFCGIHVISSKIFNFFPSESHFDIMEVYMNLVKMGENLICYDINTSFWEDLGKIS